MSAQIRYQYRAWRYRLWVDPAELRFVREKLRGGQVAADVGCHKGAYTYWLQRAVGQAGEVVAFEPQPQQAAYLQNIFAAMRYQNITLVPKGVSDRPGTMTLHIPKAKGATHQASFLTSAASELDCESMAVEVTTLDAFFAERPRGPDFLKIDVEGHESAVLAGAGEVLAKHRPTILVECEARHRPDSDVQPVFDLLAWLGYAGSFFHRGQRRPLSEFRPHEHQPHVSPAETPPPGYVNNFAFEHPVR